MVRLLIMGLIGAWIQSAVLGIHGCPVGHGREFRERARSCASHPQTARPGTVCSNAAPGKHESMALSKSASLAGYRPVNTAASAMPSALQAAPRGQVIATGQSWQTSAASGLAASSTNKCIGSPDAHSSPVIVSLAGDHMITDGRSTAIGLGKTDRTIEHRRAYFSVYAA